VSGHKQPLNDLPLHDVAFHNFRDIGFGSDPIPNPFGIDYDAGTVLAMVQASSFVRSNGRFQFEPFDFFFEKRVELFGAQIRAAPSRIILWALVDTDKNMMLIGDKRFHNPTRWLR
jgi:hypothetical protein